MGCGGSGGEKGSEKGERGRVEERGRVKRVEGGGRGGES